LTSAASLKILDLFFVWNSGNSQCIA
jgi:hypothetical protein